MITRTLKSLLLLTALAMLLLPAAPSNACTGIQVNTNDGTVIRARTMEFGFKMDSDLLFFPRGQSFSADMSPGQKGMDWKNKHAYIGLNLKASTHLTDGMNETGLYVGGFYFPDFVGYENYQPKLAAKTLSQLCLGDWILGSFSNVAEVKKAVREIRVTGAFYPLIGKTFILPVHWIVVDKTGAAIVIEYVKGKLNIHENPVGAFSNGPPFDWHMINLRNYVNLSATNVPPLNLKNLKLAPIGQGSGMLGLPGDYTPPSRFVRAAALSLSAKPVKTADEGVNQAWHIINNIDIVLGGVRGIGPDGKEHYESTQWMAVYDLANMKVYVRTYHNLQIRAVSLKKLDPKGKKMLTIPVWKVQSEFKDVSNTAR